MEAFKDNKSDLKRQLILRAEKRLVMLRNAARQR
jgi:hypothetical protein